MTLNSRCTLTFNEDHYTNVVSFLRIGGSLAQHRTLSGGAAAAWRRNQQQQSVALGPSRAKVTFAWLPVSPATHEHVPCSYCCRTSRLTLAAAATFTASASTAPRLRNSIYLLYSDYLPPKESTALKKFNLPALFRLPPAKG